MNYTFGEETEVDYGEVCSNESLLVSTCVLGVSLVISEVLPFLNSHKGNGIVDLLLCMLDGSECIISQMIKCLKGKQDEEEQGQSQQQEQQQEQKQLTQATQSINININEKKKSLSNINTNE